ncbi:MAG: NAD+ synthase [Desulfovibrionales bacterium]
MKIALLQLNYTVGDVKGNSAKIREAALNAHTMGASLCITSELALTGYPPKDLLFDSWFIDQAWATLKELATSLSRGPDLLVGAPERAPDSVSRPLYNTAFLLSEGKVAGSYRKKLLPNYDVFDEVRYFEPARKTNIATVQGMSLGVTVCEDIWNDDAYWIEYHYGENPVECLMEIGANVIVNLSASPFSLGKQRRREEMIGSIARKYSVPFVYANQVGGNDDLVFDGRSCVFGPDGSLLARARSFGEDILVVDLDAVDNRLSPDDRTIEAEAWSGLVLGTRDYVRKSGFDKVLLGLSGGIDSSLTAAIAVEALGAENVLGVLMPSPFTSTESMEDAQALAANLGMQTMTLPIHPLMQVFESVLHPAFRDLPPDVTEENLQARIRGNLLMALSNKFGSMLISTGNKSELAVGYCTIYGDMSGGFAAISDVPKTLVYSICEWLNQNRSGVIPENVLRKPPSAELKPDQTDQDVLPPYEILDDILNRIIQHHASVDDLAAEGFDRTIVEKIVSMIRNAEFKRKQSPPGIKITDRAFGTGWRMPIACRIRF